MHRAQKPLVSSSSPSMAASRRFHLLSFQLSFQQYTTFLHPSLSVLLFILLFSSPLPMCSVTVLLLPHVPRACFSPLHLLSLIQRTLVPSFCLKWNTTHKKNLFPSLELLDQPKLFTSTYLHHISRPREKCFYFQPQVMKSGWPFFILSGMIVSLRWV